MDLFYTNVNNFDIEKKHKRGHIAARRIIEYCAKNFYNIENPELEIVDEKPQFKYSTLQFSISHSGEYAAVCFDKNPVGFDIERIRNRDYKLIAQRMQFELKENSLLEFYRCWTEYEATFKLHNEVKYRFCDTLNDNYVFFIASNNEFKLERFQELFF